MLAHPPMAAVKVTEKPPPGPMMKRKKKLGKSLVDLSCSPKLEEKRQKISDDQSSNVNTPTVSAPKSAAIATSSVPRASGAKAKELQNHTLFKLKRKNEETNASLVQKLNAYTEQLRLEVNNLKTALVSEKNAVRALRWVIWANFSTPEIIWILLVELNKTLCLGKWNWRQSRPKRRLRRRSSPQNPLGWK